MRSHPLLVTLTATPPADSVRTPVPNARAGTPGPRTREDRVEVRTRRAHIADVAREAGVSKTAVSFAFNSPERLSAGTVDRIRRSADALGYRPHPVARTSLQANSMTIGLLTPQELSVNFANPFYSTFCGGLASVTEDAGYGLLFVSPLRGSLMRALSRATVDGFVAVGLSEDHPEVEQIRRAGLPMVLVDGDAARLIRRRGTVDDLFRDEVAG